MESLKLQAASLVVLLASVSGMTAKAATCTDYDFRGTYGATVEGNFITPPPGVPAGPTARVGLVNVDGNGNSAIQAVLSLDGEIINESYTGVYQVNSDCSMSVTLYVPFPGYPTPIPFTFSGALSDDDLEVNLLLLSPAGTNIEITLRKQRNANCAMHDLNGTYTVALSGSVINQPGITAGFFRRTGQVTFDGAGSFTAATEASYSGNPASEQFSGAYTVNDSCTFLMGYSFGGQDYSWSGVITDNGAGARLLVSAPAGSVIYGALTQQ